jgi:beta-galactosidase/beta-glucuronidase
LAIVRIDGEEIGQHASGYTAFEYEITDKVEPGRTHQLEVEVHTFGPFHKFDNLDFWHLVGIYRPVTLEARPAEHITDWHYRTDWHAEKGQADVWIGGQMASNRTGADTRMLRVQLNDLHTEPAQAVAGKCVIDDDGTFETTLHVDQPRGWTAETPNLYRVQLELTNKKGKLIDSVEENIGLREIETRNGKLLVNGRPIRLFGAARHDLWPPTGRVVPDEVSRRDVELMKQMGLNAVRTAHHPPDEAFLKWADRLGLYVIDNIPMSNLRVEEMEDPAWLEPALMRTRETVLRDRNHPSVIMWAIGNENHMTGLHRQMREEIRQLDGSRVAILPGDEGDAEFPEIASRHYQFPERYLESLLRQPGKPFVTTEFNHSLYEGGGGLTEVMDIFELAPNGTGGTIWEWMDQGILNPYGAKGPEVEFHPLEENVTEMPGGFGMGNSPHPLRIDLIWKGKAGAHSFRLKTVGTADPELVEVFCDGLSMGAFQTAATPTLYEMNFRAHFDGEHRLAMIWDRTGGGFNFDMLELLGEENDVVWRLGKTDGSHEEFDTAFEWKKLEKPRLDARNNQGSDGFMDPYREPGPEAPSVPFNFAPVRLRTIHKPTATRPIWAMRATNRMSFTDLEQCPSQWRVQIWEEGRPVIKQIDGPAIDLAAMETRRLDLDLSFLIEFGNAVISVEWAILPPEGSQNTPPELGWLDINFSDEPPMPERTRQTGEIQVARKEGKIEVSGKDWQAMFDEEAGGLVHYKVNGQILIDSPVRAGLWRPPLRHEYHLWNYGHTMWKNELKQRVFRQPQHCWAEQFPGEVKITFGNTYTLGTTAESVMEGIESYRISTDGRIHLQGAWRLARDEYLYVRRIGFDVPLAPELTEVTWSGPGPENTYIDRRDGYRDHVHVLQRNEAQVEGNKTGVRWMQWQNPENGGGLLLVPDDPADVEPSVNPGVSLVRIGRARGCGTKYWPPMRDDHLLRLQWDTAYHEAVELIGF